jgi:hypothetical protein
MPGKASTMTHSGVDGEEKPQHRIEGQLARGVKFIMPK